MVWIHFLFLQSSGFATEARSRGRVQKETFIVLVNLFLTRVPRLLNMERTFFSTNGTGKTGHPHEKE